MNDRAPLHRPRLGASGPSLALVTFRAPLPDLLLSRARRLQSPSHVVRENGPASLGLVRGPARTAPDRPSLGCCLNRLSKLSGNLMAPSWPVAGGRFKVGSVSLFTKGRVRCQRKGK